MIDKHDLSNAEVIQCSKELDELIVEYENKNIKIYTNKTTTDLSVVSFLIDKFYYFIYIYIFTFS
ncbi:aspartyl-phosphate phosphatase Spo0E family protein [Clostridium botulinum]|nr:aspartyl-phosphate phosphatase Spo0E family protein [Clostridium botulinum]